MPFRTFADGDTLTAKQVNEEIMNQQVMVFNNAAARDVALEVPIHGMTVFLKDRERLTFYNGSIWRFV